jgi:hypothetical protein
MKRGSRSRGQMRISFLILGTALFVFVGALVHGSAATAEGSSHFTVTAEHLQNFSLMMGELESLGLSGSDFARALEGTMASMLRDDDSSYYLLDLPALDAAFDSLDPYTQTVILSFIAQLPVPGDPGEPGSLAACSAHCVFASCSAADTVCDCWCDKTGHPHCKCCNGPSRSEPDTWGMVKALYR